MDRRQTRALSSSGPGPSAWCARWRSTGAASPSPCSSRSPAPVEDQRAASLHPSTLEMLDDLGVTEKIIPLGLISSAYRFHDRVSQSVVAEFDLGLMRDEFRFPFVLQYEQYKLTASIAAEYANAGDFDVRFSHCVTGLTETADGVEVEVQSPGGVERYPRRLCDRLRRRAQHRAQARRHRVRRLHLSGALHQDRDAASTSARPIPRSRSAIISPIRTSGATCSRCRASGRRACGAPSCRSRPTRPTRWRCRRSGSRRGCRSSFPSSGRYEIEYVNVYGAHQCVAATFRKGRVLLAGDSAHVNNPIGGMGMNGGIHDGINLAGQARPRHPRRGRRRTARPLQPPAPPRRGEIRPGADHRQQAADGGARPRGAAKNFDELRRTAENPETAKAYMRRAALADSLRDAAAVT